VLELDARGIFNPVAQLGLVHSNTPEHCVFFLCFGGVKLDGTFRVSVEFALEPAIGEQ
jgi:hypothetical protein